jgi:hypothetical protein
MHWTLVALDEILFNPFRVAEVMVGDLPRGPAIWMIPATLEGLNELYTRAKPGVLHHDLPNKKTGHPIQHDRYIF